MMLSSITLIAITAHVIYLDPRNRCQLLDLATLVNNHMAAPGLPPTPLMIQKPKDEDKNSENFETQALIR
jgi:hypothetical protein